MITGLYILLPLAFVAAMLNASVGGGGLVLIPGMFICPACRLVGLGKMCKGHRAGYGVGTLLTSNPAAVGFGGPGVGCRILWCASGRAGHRHTSRHLDEAVRRVSPDRYADLHLVQTRLR